MNNSELYGIAKRYENRDNPEKAYQYYLEATLSEDDGEAMYALAQMYFEGDYVHESYDKAGRYFGMAYDQKADIAPWTLIIAGTYWEQKSDENEENLLRAIKYYKAAAEQGVSFGYECIGKIHFDLEEYDKAYANFIKMDGSNPCGFYYLGRLYEEGLGVESDREKAVELYRKAVDCDLDNEEYHIEDDHCVLAKQRLREMGVIES